MSASKTADRLGIPQTTLTYWLRDGRVPRAEKISGMWLIPDDITLDDIDVPSMGRPPKEEKANGLSR